MKVKEDQIDKLIEEMTGKKIKKCLDQDQDLIVSEIKN